MLKKNFLAYSFLMPALLILGIFTFYPMVKSVVFSFQQYNMIKTAPDGRICPPRTVGLKNYQRLMNDPLFHKAMINSLKYLLIVPFIQLFAILLAVTVNRKIRGIGFFRAAYYVPVITSIVVVGIAWRWIFDSNGLLNFILVKKLHLFAHNVGWLTDPQLALYSVMFVTLWQGLGYYMVLYLAGLQSISSEYLEAARIDGANDWQVLWNIIIPLLKPTLILCSIVSSIAALKVFGEIYVLTSGGPQSATLTMVYYIFIKAFQEFDMGYASALALVLALVVGVISWINMKFFGRGGMEYY